MKFTNEITLSLPPDDVFATLTDVERVASCLPGASVEGSDGDVHRGAMRIKVGPVVTNYRGTLVFDELNAGERRAVLRASGDETGGQGSAEAQIVSSVLEEGGGSRVVVETDLQVRGRVAQFGSGPMEKIAKRMFADFAKNLEQLMTDGRRQGSADTGTSEGPASEDGPDPPRDVGDTSATAEDSLDVVGLVGEPLIRSLRASAVPVAIALLLGYLLGVRRARAGS